MNIEDAVRKRKSDIEDAARQREIEQAEIERARQTVVRPEWAIELAAGIARRGLASTAILSYQGNTQVKRKSGNETYIRQGREIYSVPSEVRFGWSIEPDTSVLGNAYKRDGFVISEQGDLWRERALVPLTKPSRRDLVDPNPHPAIVDRRGLNWLRAHSISVDDAIGVHEESIYNQLNFDTDMEHDAECDSRGMATTEEFMGAIAISTLVTIDTLPDYTKRGRIIIPTEVLNADPLIHDRIHRRHRW